MLKGMKSIKESSSNDKNQRRCILITDAESPIKDIEQLKDIIMDLNFKLEIFGVAFGLKTKSDESQKNEKIYQKLTKNVEGELIPISQAIELLNGCCKRNVRLV